MPGREIALPNKGVLACSELRYHLCINYTYWMQELYLPVPENLETIR